MDDNRDLVLVLLAVVLFGMLFPTRNGTVCGPRPAAVNDIRNIVYALKSYYDDYGHFPEISKPLATGANQICVGDPACKMSESPNSAIFDVLRAIPRGPNANHTLNPHRQKYFEMGKAKDPTHPRSGFADGPEYSGKDQGCLFDPWGAQYCIVFTTDGSGELDVSAVYSDLTGPGKKLRVPVAAFSLGKDGIVGSKKYPGLFREPESSSPPDDIVSWQ